MADVSLEDVFTLHKKFGVVPFSEVVRASCNHKIIPIDVSSQDDRDMLKHVTAALNNFVTLTRRSGARFTGQRINDVGKKFENMIEEELRKMPLEVVKLGRSGYPDFKIKYKGRDTYLEMKSTGNVNKTETQHRMFYYSSGKKITSDGRHLLLQIQLEEESNKYWKVVSWQLRDLSKLKVSLKTEFNTNFAGLDEAVLLSSG